MTLYPYRTVLTLLAGASLAACSTYAPFEGDNPMPRPNFPIRGGEAAAVQGAAAPAAARQDPPPAGPIADTPPPAAQPAPAAVESRPLDAPTARRDVPPPAQAAPPPQAALATSGTLTPVATRPVRSDPPRAAAQAGKATATGKVVDAEGPPKTHKVRKGDNLDAIAREFGVTRKELAEANDLKKPYRLHPGDVLTGPKSEAKAYVVGSGDTLYAVARRFSVTPQALADENDLGVNSRLTAGRKLILPEGFKDKGPIRAGGAAAEPDSEAAPPQKSSRDRRGGRAEPPPPAEEPDVRTSATTRSNVTGKVVSFTGKAQSYTVRKGDAVDSIADDMDLTRKELVQLNKLKPPYRLHPGQVLKGPPEERKGYVPVEGDTLALIAKRFGVTPKALAAENGLKVTATVRPGHRLTLPDNYRDHGPVREQVREPVREPSREPPRTPQPAPYNPPATRPEPTPQPYNPPPARTPPAPQPYNPPPTRLPSTPQPYSPPPGRSYTPPPQASTPRPSGPVTDAQISQLGRGKFIWPLTGEILSDFGNKGIGKRNDGIDIRANPGDPVRAAADGDIVYAGDQIPGFGNLVLVRHTDGWVTAYANLAHVDVKMQQRVTQGQQLGTAGQSGGAPTTQLHFEVRYAPTPAERTKPVDPRLVLPR